MTTHCRPRFNASAFAYHRVEKQGYTVFQSKSRPELSFQVANRTANEIAQLSTGENSMEEIVAQMARAYPSVDRERVRADVLNVIRQLDFCGAVEWGDTDNPFVLETDDFLLDVGDCVVLQRATEQEYEMILGILHEAGDRTTGGSLVYYVSPRLRDAGMSPGAATFPGALELSLRNSLFTYGHVFYLLRAGQEALGLLSVTRPLPRHCSVHVGFVVLRDPDLLGKCFDWLAMAVQRDGAVNCSQPYNIQVLIDESDQPSHKLVAAMENQGFQRLGAIPNEYGVGKAEVIYGLPVSLPRELVTEAEAIVG